MTERENLLYSDKELENVVSLYQQLLNVLIREVPLAQRDLNIEGSYDIIDIKRGLKDQSKQVFWDYLSATHGYMENLLSNQFDKNSTFRCIKLIFHSGKSIVLINNPKFNIDEATGKLCAVGLPDGVLCFDNYRKKLNEVKINKFDELYMKLNRLEKNHFLGKSYTNTIGQILGLGRYPMSDSSKNELFMALNLQYE